MNNQVKEISNVNAEKIVMQGLLENWQRRYEYEITEEDFTDEIYRAIFKLLVRYDGNVELVGGQCKNAGKLMLEEWQELESYLSSYIVTNLDQCVAELKALTKRRQQLKIAEKVLNKIQLGDEAAMLEEANKLYETETIKQQSREEIKEEIISDMFQTGNEIKRYLTCYTDIDKMTGGFYPNQLVTVAARPGIGKTMIALNFIGNQLEVGHKVAFFSLEMSTKEIYQRLYARYGEIEVNVIKGAKPMEKGDETKMEKAIEKVGKFENNLTIYDDKTSLGEIVSQIRLLRNKNMVDVVYIDYVGLVEVKAENRNLEISKITRTLKQLAMQIKIPIIIMAQLNRSVEKRYGGDEPILSDLRDSGSIEQDSDVVLMLHREDEKCLKVLIRKNRNGPLGPCYMYINPRYMQIGDMGETEKQVYMNNQ